MTLCALEHKPVPIPDDVIQHFKGISAIFQAYDGEERAIVLMIFMQNQQRVKVPVSAIKP